MRRDQEEKPKHRLLYDMKLMRPACVLLQAVAGGSVGGFDLELLGEWLVAPTPDMKMYEITDEQLEQLKVIKIPKRRR